MIEWGEKEEAFQTWSEAAAELRERYGFIKELLLARYTEYDEKKSIYGIDDDTPQIDKKLIGAAFGLVDAHQNQVAEGDPLVLPDAMINNLKDIATAARIAFRAAHGELEEAKGSTVAIESFYDNDTYNLRLLYNWAVSMWGKADTRLIKLGFVQRFPSQGGGGGGGEVPAAPTGFTFEWLEPVLQFSWDAVEGAPPMGEWPAELTGLYANYSDFPSPIIIVGHDGQIGADTHRLKRVKVSIADPDPTNADMPEENYVEGLNEDPFADSDIDPDDKCAYWACGVDAADVEGEWTGPVVGEYPA